MYQIFEFPPFDYTQEPLHIVCTVLANTVSLVVQLVQNVLVIRVSNELIRSAVYCLTVHVSQLYIRTDQTKLSLNSRLKAFCRMERV